RSDASGGGHAHAGLMSYLGTSWPSNYRGQLFLGNIHGQRLNVDVPVAAGSGYIGKHGADFLNFNDTWSQTLNQRYDPDGSVYIIDWYDKNQCHHNNEAGHDRSNGRIYKVVYHDSAKTPVDLTKLSDEELVKLVPSKNEWMSRHARRILQERVARAAANEPVNQSVPAEWRALAQFIAAGQKATALQSLSALVDTSTDTLARIRALWALHICGAMRLEDAGRWVADSDPWVRSWVVQLYFENSPLLFQTDLLKELAQKSADSLTQLAQSDSSPVVRRFVASALQRVPVEARWDALTALLQHAEDAGDHNLPQLYWMAAEGVAATDPGRALTLLKACNIPKVREFIARRLTTGSLAAN
ncbi:MAG TPA: hypothetical protein PLX89_21195, partial [Verrucomicrobiota bacterium]|nr:hypothetical protein [Verrucomicrobiota bacterium]